MTQEELEKAVLARIEIPADKVSKFWELFDMVQMSPSGRYKFWKEMVSWYPAVRDGTWEVDVKVFAPALIKKST